MKEAPKFQIASVFGRFWANTIDGLLIGGVLGPVSHFANLTNLQASLLYSSVGGLYEITTIAFFGRTVGKRLMSQRVLTSLQSREAPGLQVATIRCAVKTGLPLYLLLFLGIESGWIDNITFFVIVVMGLSILLNKLRRGLHDRAADTYVVLDLKANA